METESIAVAPSEEQGNVPAEAPSEPIAPVVPLVEEPATPAEPTVELFDLPDGRKVDAATLSKEWKDNFYPDYTKKSQALAAKTETLPKTEPAKSPLSDPNYVPQTYEELAQQIEQRLLGNMEAKERAQVEARQALENSVSNQLNEIKAADPSLNENLLFQHAVKYGFQNLKLAHQNMKDFSEQAKKVQQVTVKNIAKRDDPVSITPGASGGAKPDRTQFASAIDYMRSIKP